MYSSCVDVACRCSLKLCNEGQATCYAFQHSSALLCAVHSFPSDRSTSSGTFILIRSGMTWTQAHTYCSQYHTNLASIHNAQEQQLIFNVVGNSTIAYFGLISGQWSDEGFSTFRSWANGQAVESVSTDECAAMMMSDSGKWNQRQCVLQNPFICYGGE
uniref:C-type lectin domain-containing protein n=1 Tax=Pygocentrus nattereri TaxID=42514 RepID=A0A3B4C4F5_PYGNA